MKIRLRKPAVNNFLLTGRQNEKPRRGFLRQKYLNSYIFNLFIGNRGGCRVSQVSRDELRLFQQQATRNWN